MNTQRVFGTVPDKRMMKIAKAERSYLIKEESERNNKTRFIIFLFFISFLIGLYWVVTNAEMIRMFLYS